MLLHARRIRCPLPHGCRGRHREERPAAAGGRQRRRRPPRPRQRSNGGGRIIAPPLPRDVRNRVVPPPPAPPPIDVHGPGVRPPRAPARRVRPPRVRSRPRCPPRCLLAERSRRAAPRRTRRPPRHRQRADDGGRIITPPLPRDVNDRVVPPPPAPPPVNVRGPVLAAPPLVACVGRRQRSNYRAAAPPRSPRSGRPSSAGTSSCRRPRSHPRCAPARCVRGPTTAVELSRRRSPATSTIGSSLLRRRLLLSTSAILSLSRPRSSRASSARARSSRPPPPTAAPTRSSPQWQWRSSRRRRGGRYRGMPRTRRRGTWRCQGAALLVPRVRNISLAGSEERPRLAGRVGGGSRVAGTRDRDDRVLRSMRRPGPGLGGTGRAGGAPVQRTVLPRRLDIILRGRQHCHTRVTPPLRGALHP
jgi:hypothetical protein